MAKWMTISVGPLPGAAARYTLVFQHLRAAALPPRESAQLIEDVAQDW